MTTDKDNVSPPGAPGSPPSRAFAQGTGVLLQTVGVLMLLVSGCLWTIGGEIAHVDIVDGGQVVEQAGRLGMMMTIVSGTVAGFALTVFGLGLQTDQRNAAYGAVVVNVLLVIFSVTGCVLMWGSEVSIFFRVTNGVLLPVGVGLVPFTLFSLREVMCDPPAKGMEVLPGDYKIPYSHLHDESPAVRMEKELFERKRRLEAEQREIERLERELKNGDKE